MGLNTVGDPDDDEEFPVSRQSHGCVQDPYQPSVVYINGGRGFSELLRDTWRIDLDTARWTRIKSLSLPRGLYFHSTSATPDGRMFVFGGICDEQNRREYTSEVFVARITIPKLADACWEAVQHYIRNSTIVLPKDVRTLGLPKKYENQLMSSSLVSDA